MEQAVPPRHLDRQPATAPLPLVTESEPLVLLFDSHQAEGRGWTIILLSSQNLHGLFRADPETFHDERMKAGWVEGNYSSRQHRGGTALPGPGPIPWSCTPGTPPFPEGPAPFPCGPLGLRCAGGCARQWWPGWGWHYFLAGASPCLCGRCELHSEVGSGHPGTQSGNKEQER